MFKLNNRTIRNGIAHSPLYRGAMVFLCLSWALIGCKRERQDLPQTQLEPFTGFYQPSHFPPTQQPFDVSAINEYTFALGKRLFYDPILSRDSTIACGSCHIQGSAFSHHGHDVSHGIEDKLGRRNAPGIQNLMWYKNFLWDGGVLNLELIAINAITSPVEMDENIPHILEKLRRSPTYLQLFKKAYGSEEITGTKFLNAIGYFMACLISDKSKYDDVKRGKATFTDAEQRGYQIFQEKCNTCHTEPLFTDQSFRNNGIRHFFSIDKGRYEISLMPQDSGKFRVPSLRNVEKTAPYMHDGRFRTLEEVIDHYRNGIEYYNNLDPLLLNKIPLTDNEKADLIAFLKTLTDYNLLINKQFSE